MSIPSNTSPSRGRSGLTAQNASVSPPPARIAASLPGTSANSVGGLPDLDRPQGNSDSAIGRVRSPPPAALAIGHSPINASAAAVEALGAVPAAQAALHELTALLENGGWAMLKTAAANGSSAVPASHHGVTQQVLRALRLLPIPRPTPVPPVIDTLATVKRIGDMAHVVPSVFNAEAPLTAEAIETFKAHTAFVRDATLKASQALHHSPIQDLRANSAQINTALPAWVTSTEALKNQATRIFEEFMDANSFLKDKFDIAAFEAMPPDECQRRLNVINQSRATAIQLQEVVGMTQEAAGAAVDIQLRTISRMKFDRLGADVFNTTVGPLMAWLKPGTPP